MTEPVSAEPDMTAIVGVTQADRAEAAAMLDEAWSNQAADKVRVGQWDDHPLAQAFARHRVAAEQSAASKVASLREALRPFAEAAEPVVNDRDWRIGEWMTLVNKLNVGQFRTAARTYQETAAP